MKSKVPRVITSSTLGEKKIKIYKIWWYDLNKYSWSKWFATDVNTYRQEQQKQYEFIEFNSTIHRVDAKKCSVYEYLSWRLDAFADATVNNHPRK